MAAYCQLRKTGEAFVFGDRRQVLSVKVHTPVTSSNHAVSHAYCRASEEGYAGSRELRSVAASLSISG